MKKIYFVWDEAKNKSNLQKHGVSFAEAISVFYDAEAVEFFDDTHSDEEDRFLILGMSSTLRLLLVCHCWHEETCEIRIINARKVTKTEREEYRK